MQRTDVVTMPGDSEQRVGGFPARVPKEKLLVSWTCRHSQLWAQLEPSPAPASTAGQQLLTRSHYRNVQNNWLWRCWCTEKPYGLKNIYIYINIAHNQEVKASQNTFPPEQTPLCAKATMISAYFWQPKRPAVTKGTQISCLKTITFA